MPANYPIVTKGRILGAGGEASPQVDILVLHPSYPLQLRNKKLYFAGGVVAAFECKLTLKKERIAKAFQSAATIKKLQPNRQGNPYDELNQPPIFGLLAHSHAWKNLHGDADERLSDYIREFEVAYCDHPREMLDIICISDLVVYSLEKTICIGSHVDEQTRRIFDDNNIDGGVETCYFSRSEKVIPEYDYNSIGDMLGTLIYRLTTAIAFADSSRRPFADYLFDLGLLTGGVGRPVFWEKSVLSESVVHRLIEEGYDANYWSKWAEDM